MSAVTGAFNYPTARRVLRSRDSRDRFLPQTRVIGLTRAFAFAVVFIAGWYLCLPESELVDLPWWARKIAFGPNIQVHELLFALYLLLGGFRPVVQSAVRKRYITLSVSAALVLLAVWCGTASLLDQFPVHDIGRSARLILLVLMLLGVTHWAAGNPLFILRSFLLGLTAGTLVNLAFTFMNPVVAGLLPRLLGQNSPGPPMGIAVCLAAWLILLSRNRRDTLMGMAVAVICGVGAMISYSKTGMLAASLGFLSIVVVSGRVAGSKRGRVLLTLLFALVLGTASYFGGTAGQAMWTDFSRVLNEKIESGSSESNSVQERWSYVRGVGEIVARHPMGVGYSGFRDAMMQTDAYAAGFAADETTIAPEDSNPHSLFLYYASAGGIVGGGLVLVIFFLLCRVLVRGMSLYGKSGTLLGIFCCAAYLVLAVSVPYLYNSGVMLIPVGLAAGLHAHVSASGGRPQRETHPSIAVP